MSNNEVVEAIHDLARVVIAVNGKFESKSEAVRRLNEFSIPPTRIASILAMKLNEVTSVISKQKKKGVRADG